MAKLAAHSRTMEECSMGQENQEKKNPRIGGNVGDYFRKQAANDPFFAYQVAIQAALIELAKAVKAERERQNLTVEQLAEQAQIPAKAIYVFERAERSYRSMHDAMCKALGFDRRRGRKRAS